MANNHILEKVSVPTSLGLGLISLFGIGSAYLFGFVHELGYALSTLTDSSLLFGAAQVALLFTTFLFAYYKIMFIPTQVRREEDQEIARMQQDDHVKTWRFLTYEPPVRPTGWRKVLTSTAEILKGSAALTVVIVLYFIISVWMFRFFLDWRSVVGFSLRSAFWFAFAAVIFISNTRHDMYVRRWSFLNIYTKLSYMVSPSYIQNSSLLIKLLPAVIILCAFELGGARFGTLSRADPMCFVYEDRAVTGHLVAKNSDGYFIYLGHRSGGLRMMLSERNSLAFVERSQLIGFFPTCDIFQILAR